MAVGNLTVTVHVAWWVRPYLRWCAILQDRGVTLDVDKIHDTCMRGMKVRLADPK